MELEKINAVLEGEVVEGEVVEGEVVEGEAPAEYVGDVVAAQTSYNDEIVPISETAARLYEFLETKSLEEVEAAGEVDFKPVEDVRKLDAVIEGINRKLQYLMTLDIYEMLREQLDEKQRDFNGTIVVEGIGEVQIDGPTEGEASNVVDPAQIIMLEKEISTAIDRYTKQLKDLLKERRLLSGQLYGNRSGGADLMKRKVSIQQNILKQQLLKQSSNAGKNKNLNAGAGIGFPGLIGGGPIKNG